MTIEQARNLKVGDRLRWTGFYNPDVGTIISIHDGELRVLWDSGDFTGLRPTSRPTSRPAYLDRLDAWWDFIEFEPTPMREVLHAHYSTYPSAELLTPVEGMRVAFKPNGEETITDFGTVRFYGEDSKVGPLGILWDGNDGAEAFFLSAAGHFARGCIRFVSMGKNTPPPVRFVSVGTNTPPPADTTNMMDSSSRITAKIDWEKQFENLSQIHAKLSQSHENRLTELVAVKTKLAALQNRLVFLAQE